MWTKYTLAGRWSWKLDPLIASDTGIICIYHGGATRLRHRRAVDRLFPPIRRHRTPSVGRGGILLLLNFAALRVLIAGLCLEIVRPGPNHTDSQLPPDLPPCFLSRRAGDPEVQSLRLSPSTGTISESHQEGSGNTADAAAEGFRFFTDRDQQSGSNETHQGVRHKYRQAFRLLDASLAWQTVGL